VYHNTNNTKNDNNHDKHYHYNLITIIKGSPRLDPAFLIKHAMGVSGNPFREEKLDQWEGKSAPIIMRSNTLILSTMNGVVGFTLNSGGR
jgi:hypothetical protein